MKLKLQYFGHLMRRADSLEKTLMLGNTEGRRRKGRQRMRWLDGITDSMDMSSIPDQETKISHAVEQLDLCATTKNPTQPKKVKLQRRGDY